MTHIASQIQDGLCRVCLILLAPLKFQRGGPRDSMYPFFFLAILAVVASGLEKFSPEFAKRESGCMYGCVALGRDGWQIEQMWKPVAYAISKTGTLDSSGSTVRSRE